jgi:GT2 family glycosyltransferase
MVDAEYIALLNDDTKVDSKWLEELVKVMESDKSIFAVGSKIMFYDKPYVIQHAGAKITLIGAGIDIGFGESNSSKYNIKRIVGAVCGASMLIRKDIFKRLGGFDESYLAYFEDVDLCWRSWLYGYKVLYEPKSIVYHKFGGSWGKRLSVQRLYFSHINKLRNIFKNLELNNLLKGLIFSLAFDSIRFLLLLSRKNISGAKALIKSDKNFIKDIKRTIEKRARIQANRLLRDKDLYKMGFFCSVKEGFREFFRLDFKNQIERSFLELKRS